MNNSYKQSKAYLRSKVIRGFAMEYGTFIGLSWAATFVVYAMAMRTNSAMLQMLVMFLLCAIPVLEIYFAWRFRQKTKNGWDEPVGWLEAIHFSVRMFLYACLLSGLVEYAYWEFFDNGALLQSLYEMFRNPELEQAYGQMGLADMLAQMGDLLDQMSVLSPLQLTFILLDLNIKTSLAMSVITILIVHKR